MSEAVLAYVPVLHEGYRAVHRGPRPRAAAVSDRPELHGDYRPLAKDIRAWTPTGGGAIAAWGICSEVGVLDLAGRERLAQESPR